MPVPFLCSALFTQDQYRASVMLYVNNATSDHGDASNKVTALDLDAAQSLVATCCVMAQSRTTLERVLEKEDLPYSYEQLRSMITASGVENTEIFRVTVTSASPDEAMVIANMIAWVLDKEIPNTITGSSLKVVENAVRPNTPISRGYVKKSIVGFAVGAFLSACAVLLFDGYIYDIVKSQDWLKEYYGESIPVLTSIPDASAAPNHSRYGFTLAIVKSRRKGIRGKETSTDA